jgi:hypothetical protein
LIFFRIIMDGRTAIRREQRARTTPLPDDYAQRPACRVPTGCSKQIGPDRKSIKINHD